jgi:geranylgeranyl reductase family protein
MRNTRRQLPHEYRRLTVVGWSISVTLESPHQGHGGAASRTVTSCKVSKGQVKDKRKVTSVAVAVVGAGPAGATAALTLARAGVPVTLFDRAAFPRNKPCGGGISVRVLRRFPYLEEALGRIATHAVSRLCLEGPGGESTIVESPEPAALMIRRIDFDALLVSLAVEAGAELVTGVDVVQASAGREAVALTARDGRRFEAALVVAADGVHSVIARRLGLNRGWTPHAVALDMMEETPRSTLRDLDPSTMWVAYGYDPQKLQKAPDHGQSKRSTRAAEGYAYIFPKRDHVNVGIGFLLSYYRGAVEQTPYELQRELIAELRERGVMTGESVRRNFTPFLIPVGGPLRRPGRGRVLLAGDAGGFVNAFTAEGIYYAMVSGDLAARAIIETPGAPAGDRLARRYRGACNYEIGSELRDSVLVQRYLFANRSRMGRMITNADRHPATVRALLEYAVGRRSYGSIRRRMLTRSPQLALRLMWEGARTLATNRRHPPQ